MKLQTVMTADPTTCSQDMNLAEVAHLMWDHDCGFVPVVDTAGIVLGVITDRDICMATATRRLLPEQISAGQAMSSPVHTCAPGDAIGSALRRMQELRVRRLPVVDETGLLRGVVSMNDMVLAAEEKKQPSAKDILSTLAAICAHRSAARVAV
jgi:CBS domain-containing protein